MEKVYSLSVRMWASRHKLLRYLMSGGSATAVNFAVLYVLTEKVGFHYLVSVVFAFMTALCVSFVLQKFWTFKDVTKEGVHRQAVIYGFVAIVNTGINVFLVYLLVEYGGLHYMFAQFFSSGFIAFESYFIYQLFIFKKRPREIIDIPLP
jgi:putative flippase GtrA